MDTKIKCVGVVVKPNHKEAWQTACELSGWLERRDINLIGKLHEEFNASSCGIEAVDAEKFQTEADLIVVLGGDGTMISTARLTGDKEVPVLGINYGSLGYLTEFRIEEMFSALEKILEGNYQIDRRVMLDVEHLRGGEKLASGRVLNDVVINKAALARIIEIEVELNNLFVNSFRADGGLTTDFLPVIASASVSKISSVVSGFGSAIAIVFPIARSSFARRAIASTTKSTGTRFNFTFLLPTLVKRNKCGAFRK